MIGMAKKIIIGVAVAAMFIAAVFTRTSFKDTYASQKDKFFVPYFGEDIIGMLDPIEESVLKSKNIFVGKATGNLKFVYENLIQEVVVTKNISGVKGLKSGDKIWVTGCGGVRTGIDENSVKELDKTSIEMEYINFMQKGDEYLIFSQKKLASDLSLGKKVYILKDHVSPMMYLNLTNDKSYVCKNYAKGENAPMYVRYKEIKESEFFTNSQKVLDKIYKIKHNVIKGVEKKYGVSLR